MSKFYSLVVLLGSLFMFQNAGMAQQRMGPLATPAKTTSLALPTGLRVDAAGCDTLNFPIPSSWTVTYYVYGAAGVNGFVSGNNIDNDLEKANYFDVSSTTNTYLTKVWIAFGKANGANLTKVVPVRVYDGSLGTPGALLQTVNTTLGAIRTDVNNNNYTQIVFSPAITLPASKKFFISVGLDNMSWTATPKDSLVVYSNQQNQSANAAWEKWQDATWHSFTSAWSGLNLSLIMHPFVSTNATCALNLPVTLSKFSAERVGNINRIKWTTLTEQDNRGFELQRSSDGSTFSNLSFVNSGSASGNSNQALDYTFDDNNTLDGNNYYRLKQTDKDGRVSYSNIVLLKAYKGKQLMIMNVYPNPASVSLNFVLTSATKDKIDVFITDMTGKFVSQTKTEATAGDNKVSINVSVLPTGSYMIKAVSAKGDETALSKFVKQ